MIDPAELELHADEIREEMDRRENVSDLTVRPLPEHGEIHIRFVDPDDLDVGEINVIVYAASARNKPRDFCGLGRGPWESALIATDRCQRELEIQRREAEQGDLL